MSTKPKQHALPAEADPAGQPHTHADTERSGLPQRVNESMGQIAHIISTAVEKGVSVDTLERLEAMYERAQNRAAVEAFNSDFADFKRACPQIPKSSTAKITTQSGGVFSYTFADLAQIAKVVDPLLAERGFSYGWETAIDDANMLTSTCTLAHIAGHSRSSSFRCPTTAKTKAMSPQQEYAAANTFAMRQSLRQVLGLTSTEPDNDGASPEAAEPITENQVADLASLIEEAGADEGRFLKWLGVSRLEDITQSQYGRAVKQLERKRSQS